MDSYLKGRQKTQRFHVAIPAQKPAAKVDKNDKEREEDETVVKAVPAPDVTDAPQVDLVVRDGAVRRIVIHLEDGKKLELDCVYEGEES
jgi:hypothetical protein